LFISRSLIPPTGINLAFTKALYEAGCNVLIVDLALHREAVPWLDEIESKDIKTARVAFHKADVADWKQLEEVFVVYTKEFGGTPYLVCPGAGIYEPVRTLRSG
jgi:NAD(P)-dependent dehydrogenase (short-subunit alcohol dehydrogenase family)